MNAPRETIRLDKWLFQARFFKSRMIAAGIISSGKVRIDGNKVSKPARGVGVGDVLTFAKGDDVRVIKITELGKRRGPAPEAQGLYEDLSPPEPKIRMSIPQVAKYQGKGRPTKKDRRKLVLDRGF